MKEDGELGDGGDCAAGALCSDGHGDASLRWTKRLQAIDIPFSLRSPSIHSEQCCRCTL